ncbi:MAG: hypothetical protein JHC33_10545 [Ignisphaera sp.]|nr:hypothetical protein [Ignisphaera sp.]
MLLFGGLATVFFYFLATMNFTGSLIDYLLFRFGLIGTFVIALVALSDGTLGGMTYILADSRTMKVMAEDIDNAKWSL